MQSILKSDHYSNKDTRNQSGYRWVMLAVAALTGMLVYAVPALSLPVLFPEISGELGLDIVQVGVIWAVSSLTSVFIVLLGGILGDRFGTRRVLVLACALAGVFGGLRGLAGSYYSFLAISFLLGLVQPVIPINLHKMAGEWFPRRQLGLATAVISTGFAAGLMIGSLLSASVLSPALG
ncbi:MAG: MFS transporter, partial [Anaerolineales bacterium]|nr:MFS transporter [Anaerolineales bacterium]